MKRASLLIRSKASVPIGSYPYGSKPSLYFRRKQVFHIVRQAALYISFRLSRIIRLSRMRAQPVPAYPAYPLVTRSV